MTLPQLLHLSCFLTSAVVPGDEHEQPFPYAAYVAPEKAVVRSGPSLEFYATNHLRWARKVEVYRHDNQDWCAIRPPSGSFSWVNKESLILTQQRDVARVVTDDAVTRVGSNIDDSRSAEYIKLEKGELVEVLGVELLPESNGSRSSIWYKISPPAGEFRWMHMDDLSREYPTKKESSAPSQPAVPLPRLVGKASGAPAPLPDSVEATPIGGETSDVKRVETDEDPHEKTADNAVIGSGVAKHHRPGNAAPSRFLEIVVERPNQRENPVEPEPEPEPGSMETKGWKATSQSSSTSRNVDQVDAERQLNKLEATLTEIVSRHPATWQLAKLRQSAAWIGQYAERADIRQRAGRTATRIAEFQQIQARQQALAGFDSANATAATAIFHAGGSRGFGENLGSRIVRAALDLPQLVNGNLRQARRASERLYDGQGWLMPVVTQRDRFPKYALTDQRGRITHFVTPAPGVNLSRYVRREIGLVGRQGYIPSLNRAHLRAERVVVLDRHRGQ